MIANKGYDYLCVSRSNLTKYSVEDEQATCTVYDNRQRKIDLCRVRSERNTDYYLKVESQAKALKERSMNEQFKDRFEEGLRKISESISKKGGTKLVDKVHQRIGRLRQKYPSIQQYYEIEVAIFPLSEKEQQKGAQATVSQVKWKMKDGVKINARNGIYFLRTSIGTFDEALVWKCYNTIREIKTSFRVLKTDLDLRPIFHKNDESTMAHLHLGILAYWLVNTIRYQLKNKGITHQWREIVRTMNTQKAVTTIAQNQHEAVISIRRCSEPSEKVKKIYEALNYKCAPFTRKKSVVHKTEIKNLQTAEIQNAPP